MTTASLSVSLISRFGAAFFFTGKILRFIFFFIFLLLLTSQTKIIAGYNLWQVAFFFLTFNLIDSLTQFFLREVYRFRLLVVSGNFDLVLVKPINPLFRVLAGGADILDLLSLPPLIIFLIYAAGKLGPLALENIFLYLLLVFNAFLISIAFHTLVAAIGVLTTEVDNTIMLYRDLSNMGRLPIDIYREPIRGFLTFVVPIGVMVTFPAKAIMNLLSFNLVLVALVLGITFFGVSLWFWKFSLRHYSSASS
ncbi:ABC-2 family transporter protein [Candidatus Microgenomates bacterium]|nr:ABC-2 family transporter protein [Candidatus Microgenomates bacterium]